MIRGTLALLTAGVGQLVAVLAQAAGSPTTSEVTSWVSAGGTTMVVGALVYIARLLASGHLVAYPVEQLQERSDEREKELLEMAKRAHDRERVLERILVGPTRGGADRA